MKKKSYCEAVDPVVACHGWHLWQVPKGLMWTGPSHCRRTYIPPIVVGWTWSVPQLLGVPDVLGDPPTRGPILRHGTSLKLQIQHQLCRTNNTLPDDCKWTNLGIYEVLIHKLAELIKAFDMLSTEHLSITLISPTELIYMLDQGKTALQKLNPDYTLLFPDFYYYNGMKLISFEYDNDWNLLLQFTVCTEPFTQKSLAIYQFETVPAHVKHKNI